MKRLFIYFLIFITFSGIVGITYVFPTPYSSIVNEASKKYNVDEATIYSVIKIESNFRQNIVSHKGAIGLMQIMPATGKWIATSNNLPFTKELLLEPKYNIEIGTIYLSHLLKKYDNNIENTLVAYNAGPTRVTNNSWRNFKETKNYLIKFKIVNFFYKISLFFK